MGQDLRGLGHLDACVGTLGLGDIKYGTCGTGPWDIKYRRKQGYE